MKFNEEQLSAILKLANDMVLADGKADKSELLCLYVELQRLGVAQERLEYLTETLTTMQSSKAMEIVSTLDAEGKKYVASLLGTIMVADRDIDDREVALLHFVSRTCNLPTMTVEEAVAYMKELHSK